MREETRYRVTGSLFLLALAVICLPMLLDGAGLPPRHLPDLSLQESLPEVQPSSRQVPESDYVGRVEALKSQVDDEGFLTGSGTRFGEPVLMPPGRSTGGAGTGPGQDGAGESGRVEPAAAAGEPEAAASGATGIDDVVGTGGDRIPARTVQRQAWAVQVASFSKAGNAEDFRTRLRRDGYEAFISTARLDDAVLSRVAVGPLLDRQRAESLQGELSARYDVNARLVTFSN